MTEALLLPPAAAAAACTCVVLQLQLVLLVVGGARAEVQHKEAPHYDVVVYGANAAGVMAGVASARAGANTALLCTAWPDCFPPSLRIGGLTTGGLGMTDSCHQSDGYPVDKCQLSITGGLTAEFYNRSAATYGNWPNNISGHNMPYNVEPHVALDTLHWFVESAGDKLELFYSAQVESVAKNGSSLSSITLTDGRVFAADVFIDSSYEGDLMARAGVDYTVGREANTTYNESYNGRLLGEPHNENEFGVAVDPYGADGKLLPGLLSIEDAAKIAKPGEADSTVMSYNFRLCVTQNKSNMLPFPKPNEYHVEDWEILRRLYQADQNPRLPSCNTAGIPNAKYDMNNCGPVASDLTTGEYTNSSWRNLTSWAYPEADYVTRQDIWRVHRDYQQGMLWFLSHDIGDESIMNTMSQWGLCADEFVESGGWPPSLYIREARRMIGEQVMNQSTVRYDGDIGLSSIGLSAHAEDSHNMQRFACKTKDSHPCYGDGPHGVDDSTAYAWNEGDYHGVEAAHIYQLPHWMALPKREQATNLLVGCTPSASHVAFSTFRMEPAFMILGNSVGVWAALAQQRYNGLVHSVDLKALNGALRSSGQVLEIPAPPPSPSTSGYDCRLWNRCVGVSRSPSTLNTTCDAKCGPLEPQEWLASTSSFSLKSDGSGGWIMVSTSQKSYLKKSEAYSTSLPASMKLKIDDGKTVHLSDTVQPVKDDNYYMITCTTSTCG